MEIMQNSPASQPSLEIAIVSGGRPDLLRRTLASFQELLFENFAIGRVSINIDPWFKEGRFVRECASIAGDFFPSAVILSPDSPSFGHAVKRLWQQSKCEFIFHLEDDWILEEPVLPDYVFPHFSPPVEQLRLYCKEMKGLRSLDWMAMPSPVV